MSGEDILVTRSQAYTGDNPWALQHLGCGITGRRISLTQRFINTARLRDGVDIKGEILGCKRILLTLLLRADAAKRMVEVSIRSV